MEVAQDRSSSGQADNDAEVEQDTRKLIQDLTDKFELVLKLASLNMRKRIVVLIPCVILAQI